MVIYGSPHVNPVILMYQPARMRLCTRMDWMMITYEYIEYSFIA